MKHDFLPNFRAYDLRHFEIESLRLESAHLKGNPLNDPAVRYNPLLKPTESNSPWPVVLILGGFSGNAPFYFNPKFGALNAVEVIDQAAGQGEAPPALYVFVDALTSWGGSQFLNSRATGKYESYIIEELIPALKKHYPISHRPEDWCVMGGSSGGYGALHLGSRYPEIFGHIAAIAPDSFFEASLLPEIYSVLPLWDKYKHSGLKALEELRSGRIHKMKNWHNILNVFGMASCYGAKGDHGDFELPVCSVRGEKIPERWKTWLSHDPVYFLNERLENLKKLSSIYLDVGSKDNFHLQFGTRQVAQLLEAQHIAHDFVEFDGTHFDIGDRRIEVWKRLAVMWRA